MAAPLIICAQIVVFPQGRCEKCPFDVFVEKGLIAAIEKCTGDCGSDKLMCHFLTLGLLIFTTMAWVKVIFLELC